MRANRRAGTRGTWVHRGVGISNGDQLAEPAALAANLTPEQADDGGDRLAELELAGAFNDPLAQGDAVVGELPLVQEELELARVYIVADLAKLDDAQAAKVVARARSLAEFDDDALAQAVAACELNEAAAKDLGLSSSLYQLLNDDRGPAPAGLAGHDAPAGALCAGLLLD